MWGSGLLVYFYEILDLLGTVTDIVVFGIIAMALIFGVGLALAAWAKDSVFKMIGFSTRRECL